MNADTPLSTTPRTAAPRVAAVLAALGSAAAAQPLQLPFTDAFESGSVDGTRWSAFVSTLVNGNALNEPSPDFALNFFGAGQITSRPIAANVISTLGEVLTVSFWIQHRGVEPGETVMVEYTDNTGQWKPLTTVVSDGVDQSSFAFIQEPLPVDGYSPSLQIRFTSTSTQFNDNWFIDNVRVGAFAGTNPPFIDSFEDGFDTLTDWGVAFNTETRTDIPNPPTGSTVARLNAGDRLETVNQLLGVEPNVSQQQYVRFWARASGPEPGEVLRVEYLDGDADNDGTPGDTAYRLIAEIPAEGFTGPCFRLVQFPVPMEDNTDEFRVRFTPVADEANDFWFIDDFSVSATTVTTDPGCVLVDLVASCGVLDLADADAFITGFLAAAPAADLVPPFGVLDLADIDTFITTFTNGCNQPYGEPAGNLVP